MLLVGDLERQVSRAFDPLPDRLFARQEIDGLAGFLHAAVRLRHRLREVLGVAVLEAAYCDAYFAEQPRIVVADAFNAHVVGGIGPFQDRAFINADRACELFTVAHALRMFQELGRGANALRFELRCNRSIHVRDFADGVGHSRPHAKAVFIRDADHARERTAYASNKQETDRSREAIMRGGFLESQGQAKKTFFGLATRLNLAVEGSGTKAPDPL